MARTACPARPLPSGSSRTSTVSGGPANEARRRGYDGVVCGHIHKAEIRDVEGVLYCNDGDWVESLTALVEKEDGSLAIVRWNTLLDETHPELEEEPALA